jgi:isoleucyl-tRNA synthetase
MSDALPRSVFSRIPSAVQLPALEVRILALWRELDAFQESNRRRKAAGGPEFVFYDGPPFATGTPHYGHLLAGTIKDIVPRYWSMRGCQVERRFGWDCHGLPIENLAQQALGWSGAAEIRAKGVAAFNEQCRAMVQTYVGEWRRIVTRMGRWVDFDHDYKTMDRDFMESVWWVFKRLWESRDAQGRARIYKAHRIMPYDPVLSTPLSNFEAGSNYKDVQDPAITVRLRLRDEQRFGAPTWLLAWTTTPWTLPENLALCVGPAITYALVRDAKDGCQYLLAQERVSAHWGAAADYEVLRQLPGAELAGASYHPLLPYYAGHPGAFRVLTDGFVSTGDGTGVVHLAPAYGEDDYRVCRAAGIALVDPLDEECRFTAAIPEYAGLFCKDADKPIIRRLKEEGSLVRQSTIVHSYPFGERSDAPLIYRAIDAWYVRVEDLRERLIANNGRIRWVPEAIGANRFGNWLREAKDWNISRNRFWGSCLPVWVNVADPADTLCYGSVGELERDCGVPVSDLHKHHLDQLVVVRGGKTYRRTPEVLDCWFESGAMPYASRHWMGGPSGKAAPNGFPAQFIAEGLDQTRGWFYTLLVLSTALFDQAAFENVVVNGLVLAEDGQKMSKSKKNYPDPALVLEEIGADALRAYLIDSPVVRGEPLRFSESGLREIVRTVVLPYWNALSFFTTYAAVDGYHPGRWQARPPARRAEIDRWILSVLQSLIQDVNREMEGYRLYNVVPRLVGFIEDLTGWYIRRTRPRFWMNSDRADQGDAYATLYGVLTTFAKVLAPFMPFITEEAHQLLVRAVDAAAPASVHWCDYPQAEAALIDQALEGRMAVVRAVVSLALKLRNDQRLRVRQPLRALTVVSRDAAVRAAVAASRALIADELNVKLVQESADEGAFAEITVKPNFAELRRRCGPKLKEISAALASWGHGEVTRLEAGERIACAGESLGLGDVLLQRAARAGAVVASDGVLTVALDTTLDDALRAEGVAREFVSVLQQERKGSLLEVSDRIAVVWSAAGDATLTGIISDPDHRAYISDEVLATGMRQVEGIDGLKKADLNGHTLWYGIIKQPAKPDA